MFGALRFLLALLVVATHVGIWIWTGVYAVMGFYVISGYLMCRVLNGRYGFGLGGLRAFFVNRFLRIYPPYWFACLLAGLSIHALGEPAASAFWEPWRLPEGLREWLDTILLVSLPSGSDESRLVPPAWALRVEVFYYVAIGLGLGRGPRIALAWLGVSLAYHAHLAWLGAGWEARYFPIPAASLPFSIGAVIYHFHHQLPRAWRDSTDLLFGVFFVWLVNLVLLPISLGTALGPARFYLNLLLVSAMVALLCTRTAASSAWRARDARLGDLSYPVYLVHMQVGLAVASLGILPLRPSPLLFLAAVPPILLTAWIMLRWIDDPVERLRDAVKRALERSRSEKGAEPVNGGI